MLVEMVINQNYVNRVCADYACAARQARLCPYEEFEAIYGLDYAQKKCDDNYALMYRALDRVDVVASVLCTDRRTLLNYWRACNKVSFAKRRTAFRRFFECG